MSLKSSIVIVNEFSVPQPGGKGSRGGTPGSYVERYMARDGATESLAPIQRLRTDDFIVRYMARESAVERAVAAPATPATRSRAKYEMRQAQGEGGVAFGYGSVSLSDEQLKAASKDIQSHFDKGHTVLKTVLSFDEAYLKEHGIVAESFELTKAGDYRGHLDQMKLRMAIMHGLDRMSSGTSGYDDLRYVGVIQVDTEHVHCHLAMVDAGAGRLAKDGTQRGKLNGAHKSRLRRGIDAWLDENQKVAHLSSAVGYERRNVTTFIKRWAHEKIREESLPQFMIACLPEDRSLWRAGSNDKRMRKANELVTELVINQLERPGSPLPAAMERIHDYANERRDAERLDAVSWQRLVDQGRGQIVERAVNGVYQMLRALPPEELAVRTPMLEIMSMDYERMAVLAADRKGGSDPDQEAIAHQLEQDDDDFISFGFRLRSYGSRLEHHRTQATTHRDLTRQWEKADAAKVASVDSRPLYEFHRYEEDYHRRLTAKYQHFLPFMADAGAWYEQQRQVAEYGQRVLSLRALRADASLQRMKDADEAERLGREIYGQPGGRLLTQGKHGRVVLDQRFEMMSATYDQKVEDLRADLSVSGLVLSVGEESVSGADSRSSARPALHITTGSAYDFEEVKALDLHHLGYDFAHDVGLGAHSAQRFMEESRQRRALLLGAIDYLEASKQSHAIADLPVDDVAAMSRLAKHLEEQRDDVGPHGQLWLPSRIAQARARARSEENMRRSATTTLDAGLVLRVQAQVDSTTSEIARGEVSVLGPEQLEA